MKSLVRIAIAASLLIASGLGAFADQFTKGVVKKVDMKAKKVTIIHEELKNLDMPAMTMVFRTANDTILENMKAGENVEFVAERVKGKLTVTQLK